MPLLTLLYPTPTQLITTSPASIGASPSSSSPSPSPSDPAETAGAPRPLAPSLKLLCRCAGTILNFVPKNAIMSRRNCILIKSVCVSLLLSWKRPDEP